MKNLTLLLLLFFCSNSLIFAQSNEDDPFKRDPFFTKSLDDFFGLTSEDEVEQSEEKRSTERVFRTLSYTGIDLGGGFEAGPYFSNELYSQYPNLPMIHYNRVNGLFLGVRKERMQWHHYSSLFSIPHIHPHGFIGYGTASKDWEYSLGVERRFGEKRRFMIGAEFYDAISTEDYNRTGLIENSLTSFFAAYDYMDYQKKEGFGVYAVHRTARWFETAFSFNRDSYSSLNQNTSYTLFGNSDKYRINPPVDALSDKIEMDRYSASVAFNPKKILVADRFTVSALTAVEFADNNNTDEDYRYKKYWSTLTLFYNFEPGSVLRWRINAGGITGNAPEFKSFYLGGIGTLRGSPYKFFSGNQTLASNLEIQFGRPSNRPGEWISDYNVNILLFLDSGWAKDIEKLRTGGSFTSGFKDFEFSQMQHDAGVGIGSGAVRFEAAWPLKQFEGTPTFWIRFNPTF